MVLTICRAPKLPPGFMCKLPSPSGPVGDIRLLPVLHPTFLCSGACVTHSNPPSRVNKDLLNPRDEQYASRSSRAVAMGGTVTMFDVDILLEQIDLKP